MRRANPTLQDNPDSRLPHVNPIACLSPIVVAFSGGRGTADLVRRAGKAGVDIRRPGSRPRLKIAGGDEKKLR